MIMIPIIFALLIVYCIIRIGVVECFAMLVGAAALLLFGLIIWNTATSQHKPPTAQWYPQAPNE